MLHGAGREQLTDEQHREPPCALRNHFRQRRLHVRKLDGFHTAELLNVFGLLFLDDVDDVVNRDDAQHAAVARQQPAATPRRNWR